MQYEYAQQSFRTEETVEIPDEAVGVTVEHKGLKTRVVVRYLIPVEVA